METIAEADEDLLGASTLAKLSSGELDFAGVPDDAGTIDKKESETSSVSADNVDIKLVEDDDSNNADDSDLDKAESDIGKADDVENSSDSKSEE